MSKLTHLDDEGAARMVDVSDKKPSEREARAGIKRVGVHTIADCWRRNHFSGIGVHHHDTIRAGDVSPARVRIDGEVIPAPGPAEGKSLGDLVRRGGCNLC